MALELLRHAPGTCCDDPACDTKRVTLADHCSGCGLACAECRRNPNPAAPVDTEIERSRRLHVHSSSSVPDGCSMAEGEMYRDSNGMWKSKKVGRRRIVKLR